MIELQDAENPVADYTVLGALRVEPGPESGAGAMGKLLESKLHNWAMFKKETAAVNDILQ